MNGNDGVASKWIWRGFSTVSTSSIAAGCVRQPGTCVSVFVLWGRRKGEEGKITHVHSTCRRWKETAVEEFPVWRGWVFFSSSSVSFAIV